MNIHEYQAKNIFREFDIPVLPGAVASSAQQASEVAKRLGVHPWIVKAQIHAGGRGVGHFEGGPKDKGGVQKAGAVEEVEEIARQMLHRVLVTPQTGSGGREVGRVYVEKFDADVRREMYLAMLVDRRVGHIVLMASAKGGESIESADPDAISRVPIDIYEGASAEDVSMLAAQLGLDGKQTDELKKIVQSMYQIFIKLDASLVEINPLAIDSGDHLVALDAVVTLDDNALFRHPEAAELRDKGEFQVGELEAVQHGLNYVKLDGNIGCLTSGAGLSLATLDAIRLTGGRPANFLDVPPVAQVERVIQALKLVLSDPEVDSVLINVFGGGIMRCDTIADALIMVNRQAPINRPLIVRLAGTNANFAVRRIRDMGPPVVFAGDLAEASEQAVAAARKSEKVERKNWWERVMGAKS